MTIAIPSSAGIFGGTGAIALDASNATLYCGIASNGLTGTCVYKPIAGERPGAATIGISAPREWTGLVDRHAKLDSSAAAQPAMARIQLDEPDFRLAMNQDAMATEKLAEGIRQFVADAIGLGQLIDQHKAGAQ